MLLGEWKWRPSSFIPGPGDCEGPHHWQYLAIEVRTSLASLASDGAVETQVCLLCDRWEHRLVKPMDVEGTVMLAAFIQNHDDSAGLISTVSEPPPWYDDAQVEWRDG